MVTRFTIVTRTRNGETWDEIMPDSHGQWVSHEDFAGLTRERDAGRLLALASMPPATARVYAEEWGVEWHAGATPEGSAPDGD